jgi:hypothetical protein
MPRDVTITFDNKTSHVYRNVPDNVTPDQIEQRTQKEYPSLRLVSISGGKKPAPPVGMGTALGKGFARGLSDVSDTLVKAAANVVDRFGVSPAEAVVWAAENVSGYSKADAAKIADNLTKLPNFQTIVEAGSQANKDRDKAVQAERPYSYGGGRIAGQVFGTAPIPGLAGKAVARVAGGTKVGQTAATALGSSGFTTGLLPTRAAVKEGLAQAPKLVDRIVDIAVRGAAGATAGAGTSAASGQDVGLGAAIGALMPTVGSAAFRTVTDKVLLPTWERLSGQLGVQRAAAIFRDSFNMTIQEARALARSAQGDTSFAKVVARSGAEEPTVQALFKTVSEGAGKNIYAPLARAETKAQLDVLNTMARGETGRESRNAMLQGKSALGEQYAAAQERAFERANLGGKVIPKLEARGAQATQEAAEQSGLARRMTLGAERSETRLGQMDDLGEAFDPAAVGRERGIAGAMTQRGEQAALGAIRLREEAAAAQQQIADLAAQGIRALETRPLANQIRAMAGVEGAGQVQRKALLEVARQIENEGAIIRAGDLDAIRRGVNVTISQLNQGLDVGSVNKAAAGVVSQIKPLIDTSIEAAGGQGYGAAKTAFATGSTDLERQAFAGDLAGMFEKGPAGQAEFAATVGGARGTTGTVEAAFPRGGKRNFDIQEMMGVPGGAAGPSRMPALENIASEVRLNQNMARQAAEGENVAKNLFKFPRQEVDIYHKYSPIGMTYNAADSALRFAKILSDAGLDNQIQQTLAKGFRDGRSAEELLMTLPLADRAQVTRRLADNGFLGAKSMLGISSFNAMNTPPDQVLDNRTSTNMMRR